MKLFNESFPFHLDEFSGSGRLLLLFYQSPSLAPMLDKYLYLLQAQVVITCIRYGCGECSREGSVKRWVEGGGVDYRSRTLFFSQGRRNCQVRMKNIRM